MKTEEEIWKVIGNMYELLDCPGTQKDPERMRSIRETIANLEWVLQA